MGKSLEIKITATTSEFDCLAYIKEQYPIFVEAIGTAKMDSIIKAIKHLAKRENEKEQVIIDQIMLLIQLGCIDAAAFYIASAMIEGGID